MDITIHDPGKTLEREDYPGATKFWDKDALGVTFSSVTVSSPHLYTYGSTSDHYIPPGDHLLHGGDALVILEADGTWDAPSDGLIEAARTLLEQTTGIAEFTDPMWHRTARFLSLMRDGNVPWGFNFALTDQGWQQRYYYQTFGGTPRTPEWYHGGLFRSDGYNNWRYNHLFWMGVLLVYEEDKTYRDEILWPFFLRSAMAHFQFGKVHAGPKAGMSRDEKGYNYVGDSGRLPWEKQWIGNIVMAWMLTGRHPLFGDLLRTYASTLDNLQPSTVWNGAWGVRIPARIIEEAIWIALVMPHYRGRMVRLICDTLALLDAHLDRNAWWWPNKGNAGTAPASPWMHTQAIAACFRSWEYLPETRGHGPHPDDLSNVMNTVLGPRGSEYVNGFNLLRYRFDTDPARFLPNTATAYPALRYLTGHDSTWASDRDLCRTLLQEFAGSTVTDVRNDQPYPIDQIGFRFPREGAGWEKSMLFYVEALR